MKKSVFSIVVVIFFALIIGNTFAHNNPQEKRKPRQAGIEKLNLTNIQQDKFDKIQFAQKEKNIELKANMQKNRLEVKKLLQSDNFNENELKNLIKNGREIRNEMMDGRINTWFEVYNILDETQKQEWKENFKRLANDFDGGRFEGKKFDRDGKGKRMQPSDRKEFREQMNKEN